MILDLFLSGIIVFLLYLFFLEKKPRGKVFVAPDFTEFKFRYPDFGNMLKMQEVYETHAEVIFFCNSSEVKMCVLTPVLEGNKIAYVTKTEYDITNFKDEICDASNDFSMATMSHEIRTGLVNLISFSNILLDDTKSGEEKKYASEAISRNATYQLNLMESIIDLTRLSVKGATLNKEVFLFRALVEQLRDEYNYRIEEKGIKFTIINGQKNYVEADKKRLYQVFNNLLSNALKFTENGEIIFDIAYSDGDLVVNVKDSGIGIEDTSEIFKPFTQNKAKENSLGLGLHIAEKIVGLHDGKISVCSDEHGSCFTVKIPIGRTKKKIVVLEDNSDHASTLMSYLTQYDTNVCYSCDELFKFLEREKPDLLISDLYLEDECMLDHISKIDRKLPVIAVSSAVTMREQALEAGFNDFLPKPIDKDKLLKTVKGLLDK